MLLIPKIHDIIAEIVGESKRSKYERTEKSSRDHNRIYR